MAEGSGKKLVSRLWIKISLSHVNVLSKTMIILLVVAIFLIRDETISVSVLHQNITFVIVWCVFLTWMTLGTKSQDILASAASVLAWPLLFTSSLSFLLSPFFSPFPLSAHNLICHSLLPVTLLLSLSLLRPPHPVFRSSLRPASSMWPDTSSLCWAQPLWCTGASKSRGSSTLGKMRRTNATGFCFAASKRAWKPNTHPPLDDAERRRGLCVSCLCQSLVKSAFWQNDRRMFFLFQPDSDLAPSQAVPVQKQSYFFCYFLWGWHSRSFS